MNTTTSAEIVLTPVPPFLPPLSDQVFLLLLPIVAYWTFSLFFHCLDVYDLLPQYRLHTPAEVLSRNHVTRSDVVRDVIVQQIIQTVIGYIMTVFEEPEMRGAEGIEVLALYSRFVWLERLVVRGLALTGIDGAGLESKIGAGMAAIGGRAALQKLSTFAGLASSDGDWRLQLVELAYWYLIPALRLWLAIFVLDTWQYWLHRTMHEVKWLYKTFHSRHHRLYVPYAFGALYNHPLEGFLLDTVGAGLGYKISGLSSRGGMIFFLLSTCKTVDDHCGYSLPWDPLQKIFWNNAGYHDVHHQSWGIKTNYSQPFLICWDRWLGTQWTGGDVSARYAASRERAAAKLDRQQKDDISDSPTANGINGSATELAANGVNGHVKPRMPNGKAARQAEDGRQQVGPEVVLEEMMEERRAEKEVEVLRRSQRLNGRAR